MTEQEILKAVKKALNACVYKNELKETALHKEYEELCEATNSPYCPEEAIEYVYNNVTFDCDFIAKVQDCAISLALNEPIKEELIPIVLYVCKYTRRTKNINPLIIKSILKVK